MKPFFFPRNDGRKILTRPFGGALLGAGLALLLGACSVASHNQLSPDREPAAPRYSPTADSTRLDSVPLSAPRR
ncbi:hypothetical protein [Hymenobacter yonginensis]|uniref:Uncharacterized protein n=1 Tax=Hymenobacter yonginensis TaxID=748197 RepID=A0ABY7PPT8_9BACT|nr:hypothetical protein [Hymenobacter yonginensis]WBO85281.1 hypothetical protein O9Z63_03340 [Hymenobacter yonginensis]